MKHTILLALLATSLNANATWPSAGAIGLTQSQMQQSNSYSNGGNAVGGNVDIDNRRQFPILPPAIAPSQSINTICQVATPQSSATSFLFIFSRSQTDGVKYSALCLAYANGDKELTHQIACDSLPEYKSANVKLGRECK